MIRLTDFMEAANFEDHGDHCRVELINCDIQELPQQLRINNHDDNNTTWNDLPNLFLQFHLTTQTDVWYLTPGHPRQLLYMDQYHEIRTKSFDHLKLSPVEYQLHDVFYRAVERNLNNWCGEAISNCVDIDDMVRQVRYFVETKRANLQNLDMSVNLTLKIECIWDGRLRELSSFLNGGMVPASKTSIMQLPERMEIDEDECLNDECVICYEQLGKEGKKIVCMPCSPMFHGDCITTWLEKSHYCPICRYDIPTTTKAEV